MTSCGSAIDEAVPSAALFFGQVRHRKFIQAIVAVIGMTGDEAVLGPSGDGVLVDIETRGRFLFCQHSPFAQAVVARAQLVLVDEIGDPPGREARIITAAARSLAWTISLLQGNRLNIIAG